MPFLTPQSVGNMAPLLLRKKGQIGWVREEQQESVRRVSEPRVSLEFAEGGGYESCSLRENCAFVPATKKTPHTLPAVSSILSS